MNPPDYRKNGHNGWTEYCIRCRYNTIPYPPDKNRCSGCGGEY